ncbi:MAG: GGDEF domain-containing protein [Proteobacteria bacterium]|nr:GGDEF domain-containing protein [Pseudomonadota bacterium]MBU1582734.1 GGDEF domain-containing protein [Pseudomonadota bacterium]MBU2451848.1 GGDEF domain-containing protein [Pseudomonadota bacterium]MBU2631859.1 GGDEF domain-containing protein [Pseudomonadota bacterium]
MRTDDASREALEIKLALLKDQLLMETQMRENLEYAINEITDHLFTSMEELDKQTRELKKRNLELEIQDKIVKIINREISLESVLKTLLRQALYLFPQGDKGAFLQYDSATKQFLFAAVEGYDAALMGKIRLSYEQVVALTTDNAQKLDDGIFVIQSVDFNSMSKGKTSVPNPKSMLAMALSFDKKLEDLLILDNMKDSHVFDPSDIPKLLRFREHAISAVSKAKILELLQAEKEKTEKALKLTQQTNKKLESAHKKMEEMSLTDTLTKLRNRRFLSTFINQETGKTLRKYDDWLTGRRSKRPRNADLAFFMLDIDHFKWVNDTFGHDSGDRVLEQVGKLLKKNCRDSDIIIRWGGEEFLIVSLNSDQTQALLLAERIRKKIETCVFKIGNGQTIQRTCSIGFACYPFLTSDTRALDYEQVIAIADKCLYISKASGRNAWVGILSNESTGRKNLLERIDMDLQTLVEKNELKIFTSLPDAKNLSIFKL